MDRKEVRKIAKTVAKFTKNYLKGLNYDLKEENKQNFKVATVVYTEIILGHFNQNELDN